MRGHRQDRSSGRRKALSLLFARQVPRNSRHYHLHIVNTGRIAARAASWRMVREGRGGPHVHPLVSDLPSTIPPGADIVVASVDRGDAAQDKVEIIVRWVQPGGVVDESLHTLG
jgi:hypothetical protein